MNVFNRLKRPLIIVGTGSQEDELRQIANSNITFVGQVSDEKLIEYYQNAKALIFPQEEDFGIVAVEAQAAGCPVIAFSKGGATETVNKKTGVFFYEQKESALMEAVENFERENFSPKSCRANAQKFSEKKFLKSFAKLVSDSTK